MNAVENVNEIVIRGREFVETGLFTVLSNHQWFESFSHSIWHFFAFPTIMLSFSISAIIEGVKLRQTPADQRTALQKTNFALSLLATGAVDASVIGSLILGTAFTAAPWLFVAGLSLTVVKINMNLLHTIKELRTCTDEDDKKKLRQQIIKHVASLVLVGLTTTLVVGAMINPMTAPILLGIGIATVTVNAALLIWNLMSKMTPCGSTISYTQRFKGLFSCLAREDYKNLDFDDYPQQDSVSDNQPPASSLFLGYAKA